MTWVYGSPPLTYTVTAQTSQMTGYEAAKIGIYDEHSYLRSWRSNNQLTQQTLTLAFSPAVTIAGVGLFHLNGPSVQLKKSTNGGSSYTDLLTGSGSFTTYVASKHLAYYRYFSPVTGATGVTNVQIFVLGGQTPVDGATYLELGSAVFFSSLTSFPRPPQRGMRETLVRAYDRSGIRKRTAGPWRSEMDWQMTLRTTAHVDAWRTLALHGEDAIFCIAKTNVATSQAYLMSYDGALEFEDHSTHGFTRARWVEQA